MKNGVCKNCGFETTLYTNSYCFSCYSIIWDNGFENSTNWSAAISHNDFVKKLNENISNKIKSLEIITKINNLFNPGDWYCSSCNFKFIDARNNKIFNPQEIYDMLLKSCPNCCGLTYIDHDYKGE